MRRRRYILLHIDYTASVPVHKQIEEQLAALIATGVLMPNDWLPSVRQLATEISINPNTVQRAYSALEEKGIIVCVKGKGSFVASDLSAIDKEHERMIASILREGIKKASVAGWDKARIQETFLNLLDEEGTNK